MEYKVLIKLFVPEIEETYEMYIPINKKIGEITELFTKIINGLTESYPIRKNACLVNRRNGIIYSPSESVKKTDIRNGSELVIF